MVSLIIPTYNERENIGPLIERLTSVLTEYEFEIIVVDDDSPDETWARAREYSDAGYPVHVLRRTDNTGLATAVLTGIDHANYDTIVVMDADLQHPPEKVPTLIEPLRQNESKNENKSDVDIVIGSRAVEAGSFGEFDLLRRIDTAGANLLARLLFAEVRGVKDIQSGFFAFKKEIVNDAELAPIGYKILLEILVMGEYDAYEEIGYQFQERNAGDSNLDFWTILNYLVHLVDLRLRKWNLR